MMWYRNIYWSKITLLYRNEVKCHICCEYFSFVKDCTQYDCVFILFLIKFLWVSSDVYRTSNFLSLWSISSSLLCFHNTNRFCTRLPRKKLTTTKERKWLLSGILSRQPVWQELPYNQKKNQQTTWCPFQRLNEWMHNFIYRGWHITVKNW